MTAVEWLEFRYKNNINLMDYDFKQAIEMEREQKLEMLINFQVFLNENDYISDTDWDWVHMAIKFLNSKKQDL